MAPAPLPRFLSVAEIAKTRIAMKILVAIPCQNEAKTIASVIDGVRDALSEFPQFEIVVIDDGSTDESFRIASDKGVKVVRHRVSRGVGAAVQTATDYAISSAADLMVNIDADGQFNPSDIPALLAPLLGRQADFVTGTRFHRGNDLEHMPVAKRIGNVLMTRLVNWLVCGNYSDVSCGFRAYSENALIALNLHGHFTYTQESFLDLTFKGLTIAEVPVTVRYFPGRKSRVANNLVKYGFSTLLIIVKTLRDYDPLRFFLWISIIFLFCGTVFALPPFIQFVTEGRFTGWLWAAFLAGFFVLNALLFAVAGLVSDLLGRMRTNQERILILLKRGLRKNNSL
jgi:glycosyltransferase involved in cell wall biosynthesis